MWPNLFETTVTLYAKKSAEDFGTTYDEFERYVIPGCSWVGTRVLNASTSGTVSYGNDTTVRIPFEAIEAAGLTVVDKQGFIDAEDTSKVIYPTTDMYVFKGEVDVDSSTSSKLRRAFNDAKPYAFMSSEATINDAFLAKHVKLRGQ